MLWVCEARDGGRNGGSEEPRAESSWWSRTTNDPVRRVVIDWRMTGLFPPYGRNSRASIQEMTSSSHLPPCSTTPSSHPRSTVGMAVAKPFVADIAPVVGLPSISMQPCSPMLDCCACSCYCPASCLLWCMVETMVCFWNSSPLALPCWNLFLSWLFQGNHRFCSHFIFLTLFIQYLDVPTPTMWVPAQPTAR